MAPRRRLPGCLTVRCFLATTIGIVSIISLAFTQGDRGNALAASSLLGHAANSLPKPGQALEFVYTGSSYSVPLLPEGSDAVGERADADAGGRKQLTPSLKVAEVLSLPRSVEALPSLTLPSVAPAPLALRTAETRAPAMPASISPLLHNTSCPYNGITVIITRSVVTPARRGDRLAAIADTWARDLTARGTEVVVLAVDPFADCAAARAGSARGPNAALPFTCLGAPPPLDLVRDKAAVFTWLVRRCLLGHTGGGDRGLPPPNALFWCNDHTFIVAGNFLGFALRLAAAPKRVAYAGKVLESGGRRFCSGAAGVLLSRASLELLVRLWNAPEDNPECLPPERQPPKARPRRSVPGNPSFGKVKEPGLLLADCLFLAGVLPNRTRDDERVPQQPPPQTFTPNGRATSPETAPVLPALWSTEDRFHAYGPQRLVAGRVDEWYRNYHKGNASGSSDAGGDRLGSGLACCATSTASFHYVEASEARALHAVLGDQARFRAMTDAGRRAWWPPAKLLSYSSPPGPNDPVWELLTEKITSAMPPEACSIR